MLNILWTERTNAFLPSQKFTLHQRTREALTVNMRDVDISVSNGETFLLISSIGFSTVLSD